MQASKVTPLGLLPLALLLAATAAVEVRGADKELSRLDRLWQDLGSSDDFRVARATLTLAALPKESVPYLKKRLKPVQVDRKQVAKWIEQLDSERFSEREAAGQELEYLGKFIQADLKKALDDKPSLEVKRRINDLLDKIPPEDKPGAPAGNPLRGKSIAVSNVNGEVRIVIDGKPVDLTPRVVRAPGPPPGWVRAARAAAVLEHIGTPDAQEVLKKLADGEKDALPSQVAREALERLKK